MSRERLHEREAALAALRGISGDARRARAKETGPNKNQAGLTIVLYGPGASAEHATGTDEAERAGPLEDDEDEDD